MYERECVIAGATIWGHTPVIVLVSYSPFLSANPGQVRVFGTGLLKPNMWIIDRVAQCECLNIFTPGLFALGGSITDSGDHLSVHMIRI